MCPPQPCNSPRAETTEKAHPFSVAFRKTPINRLRGAADAQKLSIGGASANGLGDEGLIHKLVQPKCGYLGRSTVA